MTMINVNPLEEPTTAFWLTHPDPTQAAVHLALQWLAYVYPASELQIDQTLKSALPYADTDLSSRWAQFLEQQDVEGHVDALNWIAETLSEQQIPFLVETCWRLLLVDHELPTHVPLALRIMGQVLNFEESRQLAIGADVFSEYTENDLDRKRAPLLPVDPRYLDRIEWRLYGHSSTHRRTSFPEQDKSEKNYGSLYGFMVGTLFGAVLVGGLVFGPLQLGRLKVPIMLHDGLLIDNQVPTLASTAPETPVETASATPASTEPQTLAPAVNPLIEPVAPVIIAAQPVTASAPVLAPVLATEPDVASAPVIAVKPIARPIEAAVSVTEPAALNTVDDAILVRQLTEPTPVADWVGGRVLMEVTASILNVRREPLVDSEVLMKLATGARVWAYPGQAGGLWMAVKVEGETGYASARFLAEVDLP